MSYFRPQQAGKIDPRTIHSFSDSTSLLSQNAGQVSFYGTLIYQHYLYRCPQHPITR